MKTVSKCDMVTLILRIINITGNSHCCGHFLFIVNVYVYKVLCEAL